MVYRLKPYEIASCITLFLLMLALVGGMMCSVIFNPSPLVLMERSRLKSTSSASIIARIDDGDNTKYEIGELIQRGNTESNLNALHAALDAPENPRPYVYAIFILYKIGDEDAEEKLRELILDLPDIDSGLLGAMSTILSRYLGPEDGVFLPALEEVASTGPERIVNLVVVAIEHINDPDYFARWRVIEVLD